MSDSFANKSPELKTAPATRVALVTPSDSTDLALVSRGTSFVTAGDIKITTLDGDTVVIPSGALAAGMIHPVRASRIWSTGTTAVSIQSWA